MVDKENSIHDIWHIEGNGILRRPTVWSNFNRSHTDSSTGESNYTIHELTGYPTYHTGGSVYDLDKTLERFIFPSQTIKQALSRRKQKVNVEELLEDLQSQRYFPTYPATGTTSLLNK